jgi:hypothetical protein
LRKIFETLVRWIARHFFTFLFIVFLLAGGNWLHNEYRELQANTAALSVLQESVKQIRAYRHGRKEQVVRRIGVLQKAPVDILTARIESIETDIQELLSQQQASGLRFPLSSGVLSGDVVGSHFKRSIDLALLRQELAYLTRLRSLAAERLGREAADEVLADLHEKHVKVHKELKANAAAQETLTRENPVRAWVFGFLEFEEHAELRRTYRRLLEENRRAHKNYIAQKKIVEGLKSDDEPPRFQVREGPIDEALRPLQEAVNQYEVRRQQNWIRQASGPVREYAPMAAWILASIILLPVVVKFVFYFVLAPLASRLPPICLLPGASGTVHAHDGNASATAGRVKASAVSQALTVTENEELLIHPEYLQSSFTGGQKDTKWLLDWSYPLSSLASGLVALTRIRAARTGSVVISATGNPLSEIAILTLPGGSAVVLQPRSIVGVVTRKGTPVRITRHWRLGSLHAWLTLQMRYLVFHGNAKLIVQGCRGIRVEAAESGRSINQAATIGFSANVNYTTIRTETFWPYLTSKQALFNDCFAGESGCYIYEETPYCGRKPGVAGRGLEGLTDSVLKIFGI